MILQWAIITLFVDQRSKMWLFLNHIYIEVTRWVQIFSSRFQWRLLIQISLHIYSYSLFQNCILLESSNHHKNTHVLIIRTTTQNINNFYWIHAPLSSDRSKARQWTQTSNVSRCNIRIKWHLIRFFWVLVNKWDGNKIKKNE